MSERRPRNEISRSKALSLRAAMLLDDGAGDRQVAEALAAEFKRPIKARTVASFRKADYQAVADERLKNQDAAARVQLLLSGTAGTYAQAGQELLAKMLYDVIRSKPDDARVIVSVGKCLAKIREIEIAQTKADIEREKHAMAQKIKEAMGNTKLTAEERQRRVDEAFGIKHGAAA